MKIYAVIVTYNAMRKSWIEKCLRSLQESTVPIIPIVIDNGSSDETGEFVPSHFPEAIWLPQEKNLGFGQANNVGLRYALEHEADYVLLLNQDATIGSKAIEEMLPHCDDKAIISPIHLNGEGTKLDNGFRYCLRQSCDELLDDFLAKHHLKEVYSVPDSHVPAACWFLTRKIIETIGGFNPLFFHYGEDENYILRGKYHKVGMRICPSATMCHDRNEHGNINTFNRHLSRRLLLTAATNINFSFCRFLLEMVRILKDNYTVLLPQHQYRIGSGFMDVVWIITHAWKIRCSRNKEKKAGATWLYPDA